MPAPFSVLLIIDQERAYWRNNHMVVQLNNGMYVACWRARNVNGNSGQWNAYSNGPFKFRASAEKCIEAYWTRRKEQIIEEHSKSKKPANHDAGQKDVQ